MSPQENGTFLTCRFTRDLPVRLYRLWAQKFSRSCGRTWRAEWGCRWRRQKRRGGAGMWLHCAGALRASTPNTPRCWGSSAGTWRISLGPVHAQNPECTPASSYLLSLPLRGKVCIASGLGLNHYTLPPQVQMMQQLRT